MTDYSTMDYTRLCQYATLTAIQALCELEDGVPQRDTHAKLAAIITASKDDLTPALNAILPILRDDLALLLDLPIPLDPDDVIAQRAANAVDALAARLDYPTAETRWAAALALVQDERNTMLDVRATVAALAAQWDGVVTWQD